MPDKADRTTDRSDMKSVKEILKYLDKSEGEDLIRQVLREAPIRLPNSDWDENDPREMIDFPVSDVWLDDFHRRGMTPRHSSNYRGTRPDYKAFYLRNRKGQQSRGVEM